MTSLLDASPSEPPQPASKRSKVISNKRNSPDRNAWEKDWSAEKKKCPTRPDDAADLDSYSNVNLLDEFIDTVSVDDLAFHHEEDPSLQLRDLMRMYLPDGDVSSDSASLDNMDPSSINSESISLDCSNDPNSVQSNNLANCFLLKRRNEPIVKVPLNSAGDAIVGNLLQEAATELHHKLGEREWKMKHEWIIHWRKLRYRELSGKTQQPYTPPPLTCEIRREKSSTEGPNVTRKLPELSVFGSKFEMPSPKKGDTPDHVPFHSLEGSCPKTIEVSQNDLKHVSGDSPSKKKNRLVLKFVRNKSNGEYTTSNREESSIPKNLQPQIGTIPACRNSSQSVESSYVGRQNMQSSAQYEADASSQHKSTAFGTDPKLGPSVITHKHNAKDFKSTPSTSKKSRTKNLTAQNISQLLKSEDVERCVSASQDNPSPSKGTKGSRMKPMLKRLSICDNGNAEGSITPKKCRIKRPSQSESPPQNMTQPVESSCDNSFPVASESMVLHLDSTENILFSQPDVTDQCISSFENLATTQPNGDGNTRNVNDANTSRSADSFDPVMHSQDLSHPTGTISLKCSVRSALEISSSPEGNSCDALNAHQCTPSSPPESRTHKNLNQMSISSSIAKFQADEVLASSAHQLLRCDENASKLGQTSSTSMHGNHCKNQNLAEAHSILGISCSPEEKSCDTLNGRHFTTNAPTSLLETRTYQNLDHMSSSSSRVTKQVDESFDSSSHQQGRAENPFKFGHASSVSVHENPFKKPQLLMSQNSHTSHSITTTSHSSTSKKSRTKNLTDTQNISQLLKSEDVERCVSASQDNPSPSKGTKGSGMKPMLKRLIIFDNGNAEGSITPKKCRIKRPSQSESPPQNITQPVESSCDNSFPVASESMVLHLDSTENILFSQPDVTDQCISSFENLATTQPNGDGNTRNVSDANTSRSADSFDPVMHSQDLSHPTGTISLKCSVRSALEISCSPEGNSCDALNAHQCTPSSPPESRTHKNLNQMSISSSIAKFQADEVLASSAHQLLRCDENASKLGQTSSTSMHGNHCKNQNLAEAHSILGISCSPEEKSCDTLNGRHFTTNAPTSLLETRTYKNLDHMSSSSSRVTNQVDESFDSSSHQQGRAENPFKLGHASSVSVHENPFKKPQLLMSQNSHTSHSITTTSHSSTSKKSRTKNLTDTQNISQLLKSEDVERCVSASQDNPSPSKGTKGSGMKPMLKRLIIFDNGNAEGSITPKKCRIKRPSQSESPPQNITQPVESSCDNSFPVASESMVLHLDSTENILFSQPDVTDQCISSFENLATTQPNGDGNTRNVSDANTSRSADSFDPVMHSQDLSHPTGTISLKCSVPSALEISSSPEGNSCDALNAHQCTSSSPPESRTHKNLKQMSISSPIAKFQADEVLASSTHQLLRCDENASKLGQTSSTSMHGNHCKNQNLAEAHSILGISCSPEEKSCDTLNGRHFTTNAPTSLLETRTYQNLDHMSSSSSRVTKQVDESFDSSSHQQGRAENPFKLGHASSVSVHENPFKKPQLLMSQNSHTSHSITTTSHSSTSKKSRTKNLTDTQNISQLLKSEDVERCVSAFQDNPSPSKGTKGSGMKPMLKRLIIFDNGNAEGSITPKKCRIKRPSQSESPPQNITQPVESSCDNSFPVASESMVLHLDSTENILFSQPDVTDQCISSFENLATTQPNGDGNTRNVSDANTSRSADSFDPVMHSQDLSHPTGTISLKCSVHSALEISSSPEGNSCDALNAHQCTPSSPPESRTHKNLNQMSISSSIAKFQADEVLASSTHQLLRCDENASKLGQTSSTSMHGNHCKNQNLAEAHSILGISCSPEEKSCDTLNGHHFTTNAPTSPLETRTYQNLDHMSSSSSRVTNQVDESFDSSSHQQGRAENPFKLGHASSVSVHENPFKKPQLLMSQNSHTSHSITGNPNCRKPLFGSSSHQQGIAENAFVLGNTSSVSMDGNHCKKPQLLLCQSCHTNHPIIGSPICGKPSLNVCGCPSVPMFRDVCNVACHPVVPQCHSACQYHNFGGFSQSPTCLNRFQQTTSSLFNSNAMNFNARCPSQPAYMPCKCPSAFHLSDVGHCSQALSSDNSSRFCSDSAKNSPFNLIGDGKSHPPPMLFQSALSDMHHSAGQNCCHTQPSFASRFSGDSTQRNLARNPKYRRLTPSDIPRQPAQPTRLQFDSKQVPTRWAAKHTSNPWKTCANPNESFDPIVIKSEDDDDEDASPTVRQ